MAQLDQTQLAQIVGAVLAALRTEGTAPKPAASAKPSNSLEAKDRALISGFKRRGVTDIQLMDRNDPEKPFNVRPFKGWLEQGRMVRKGERGIRGLFHQSQTDLLPTKASPKAAPAQKPTAKPVQSKPGQLPLA